MTDNYVLDRKKDMSHLARALIAQGLIFNIVGFLISDLIKDQGISIIFTAILGILPLYLYTGRDNFNVYIKSERKKFNIVDILILFSVMMLLNTLFSQIFDYIEVFLNLFGLSAVSEANSGEASATVSMIVYGIVIAPIVEEIIYRGVLMRSLEKYGSYSAIIISSILFGTMHQDILQSPVTMFVGVILAYAAYKYSIKLSIILHILNNLIVEMSAQLSGSKLLLVYIFNISVNILISFIFVVFIFKNRQKIKEKLLNLKKLYLKAKKRNKEFKIKGSIRTFFRTKSVIVLLILDFIVMFAGIVPMK